MSRTLKENITHLLGRAGFGASPAEVDAYAALGYAGAVDRLVNYEQVPDDTDSFIGKPGYAAVMAEMANYHPDYDLTSARVRWSSTRPPKADKFRSISIRAVWNDASSERSAKSNASCRRAQATLPSVASVRGSSSSCRISSARSRIRVVAR